MSPAPPADGAGVLCAVALGSNLGDRAGHLERAVAALGEHPRVTLLAVSPLLETVPVGGPEGQGPYLNGALLLRTDLGPEQLLDLLQDLEARAGRDRRVEPRHGPRTLDLDLLLYGERALAGGRLQVPHPGLEQRQFVLEPLAHIAPDLRLPSGASVRERLAELRQAQASGGGRTS
jgi:2-amino-4-hydroxy-6-hydroxymethyldihydropteridine diphosphokinase